MYWPHNSLTLPRLVGKTTGPRPAQQPETQLLSVPAVRAGAHTAGVQTVVPPPTSRGSWVPGLGPPRAPHLDTCPVLPAALSSAPGPPATPPSPSLSHAAGRTKSRSHKKHGCGIQHRENWESAGQTRHQHSYKRDDKLGEASATHRRAQRSKGHQQTALGKDQSSLTVGSCQSNRGRHPLACQTGEAAGWGTRPRQPRHGERRHTHSWLAEAENCYGFKGRQFGNCFQNLKKCTFSVVWYFYF